MKYLFLDTNIFIHFLSYEEIPWREIVGDDYKLMIAPIVLDELDKHKTNSNKKIAKRVKNILPKIEKEENSTNSIIDTHLPVPKEKTFDKYNFSKNQQDHALLSAILEFAEQHDLTSVVLISYDTGPRMRARQLGIPVIVLSDIYLLADEESEEEKELRRLQKEIKELKNTLPNVVLTFDDGKKYKQAKLHPILQTEDEFLMKEME